MPEYPRYVHPNHTGDITSIGDGVTAISTGVVTHSDLKIKTLVELADADATLTYAQIIDSGIFTITPTVARNLTLPGATIFIGNIPGAIVGTWLDFTVINNAAYDVSLILGTGTNSYGNLTINGSSGTWKIRVNSGNSITLFRI